MCMLPAILYEFIPHNSLKESEINERKAFNSHKITIAIRVCCSRIYVVMNIMELNVNPRISIR